MSPKSEEETHQPSRVIVGHCPQSGHVVVLFNSYEVWPYVSCLCGWKGATSQVMNRVRFENNWHRGER